MQASSQQIAGPRRFAQPYDWDAIDAEIHATGGVIVEGLFSAEQVETFNHETDAFLATHDDAGKPHSGSSSYDQFLGHRTIRMQGLIEKIPSAADWIGDSALCDWANRTLEPVSSSVLLNAAELIQIGPGEARQYLHRDTDSWPVAPLGEHPLIVNALVALDEFTLANGATHLVPGSFAWARDKKALPEEMLRAEMAPGDGLLFRGDIVHGGGANGTDRARRAISLSDCVGWLRPVENSFLYVPRESVKRLPRHGQALLGYAAYDGSRDKGGLVGLYENGDPAVVLED